VERGFHKVNTEVELNGLAL